MNKSYLYANGNIHVFDSENNKKVIPYTDNFMSRLIIENNLNRIENLIKANDYIIESSEANIKDYSLINIFKTLTYSEFGYIFPFFVNEFLKIDFNNILEYNSSYVFALLGFLIGVASSEKRDLKLTKRILKSRINIRNELVIIYNKEKQIYDQLLSDNKREYEYEYQKEDTNLKRLYINDKYEELSIDTIFKSRLYYMTNKKVYHKYYKKGLLEENLEYYLTQSQILLIKQYIKDDQEKKYVKKRLNKKA